MMQIFTSPQVSRWKHTASRRVLGLLLMGFATFWGGSAKAQSYCTSGLSGASYSWIDSVAISGTTLQSASGMAASYYNLFPTSGSTTATLVLGQTYSLYVRTDITGSGASGAIVSAWIDYNQDFTFAASEWVQVSTTGSPGTVSITVPATATPGTTRLRIRSRGTGNPNGSGDACASFGSGETEDYTITIQSGTPCSGTPLGGTTVSTTGATCPGSALSLSVNNSSINSGLTFQWLQLVSGVWTPITGATGFGYTTPSLTGGTYQYRRKVTCTASGGTDTSTAYSVTIGSTPLPYVETFESITSNNQLPPCMAATNLASVVYTYTTATGSWNQTNHTPGGSKFASFRYGANDWIFTPGFALQTGKTYRVKFWYVTDGLSGWTSISAKAGTSQTAASMTTNIVTISSPVNSTYSQAIGTFQVPANGSYNIGINVVGSSSPWYVSVDDIELAELPPCTGRPVAGTVVSNPVNPCLGNPALLSVTGSSSASGISYQWQRYNAGTSTWANVAGATVDNYTTPAITDSVRYRLIATCTNAGGLADTTASFLLNPYGVTLPYLETFEGIAGNNQLPDCWAATNLGSVVYTYTTATGSWNQTNHTPGGSKYASFRYGANDWLFSRGFTLQTGKTYRVKFWYVTDGLSGWTSISAKVGIGQNAGAMTTNIVSVASPINSTYAQAIGTFQVAANGSYNIGINVVGSSSPWYVSVDDIELAELPPCTGRPVAGTVVSDPASPCLGNPVKLSLTGSTTASGINYQWQTYNKVTGLWTTIAGATLDNYTTPQINDSVRYRLIATCTNAGGLADTSAAISLSPFAATLPLLETFESITANNQLPNCWAADELGTATKTFIANQTSYNSVNHTPGGSKFATFYYSGLTSKWYYSPGVKLDTGKTYQFSYWYITDGYNGWNALRATYGTGQNAGAQINTISTIINPINTTYLESKTNFTVTTAGVYNVAINCDGSFAPYYLTIDDIGLKELPPCSGAPNLVMGQADTISICPDTTAFTTLRGSAGDFSGLVYQWDSSVNGTAWFPITGANAETHDAYSSSVFPNIYYRVRVTCVLAGGTDTGYVALKVKNPTYAPLPYFNGFETWVNSCAETDVPSGGNWKQYWFTGNASWRRNDQGASANWTSPTLGVYTPAAQSGLYSARFHSYTAIGNSPSFGFGEGQLDMYLDCSASLPAKGLYFYHRNLTGSRNDSLTVWYSIDGGLQFNQIDGWDTANAWTRRVINIPSNSPATIISFRARKFGSSDFTDIGIDSVYVAEPCTGLPVAGSISLSGTTAVCAGSSVNLLLTGTTMAGNILVEWEASTTSSTAGYGGISIPGTQYNYTTPAVTANTWYRAKVTCGISGTPVYSNVIAVTTTPAVYATIPYVEDFENWSTRCVTSDIPSVNWTNAPATGNQSWRRFDQGSTASWTTPTTGAFFPSAAVGNYSARFHNYYADDNTKGRLDLYVNCSGAGNKELRYYVNMNGRTIGNIDYLNVSYSMNGGITFSNLTPTPITITNGWVQKVHLIPSNSATTIVRFEANADRLTPDIAIDYVEILPACTGKPVAGVIDSVRPCAGSTFQLKANGTSQMGGLTYQWQSTTAATATGFANVPLGGTAALYNTAITQPTWYRLIVSCAGSNQSDTTAPFRAELGSFYNCYCMALPYYPYTSSAILRENIGSVKVEARPAGNVLLENGVALPLINNTTSTNPQNPGYTSYTNLAPVPMYRDSAYRMTVQQVSAGTTNAASGVAAWIDFNQDGTFDQNTERVFMTGTSLTAGAWTGTGNFNIPANAQVGVTGMRVILAYNSGNVTTPPNVCGTYTNYGETEDYLVEIRYNPCTGPVNAGLSSVSDTATCPGYKVTLMNTTYEKQRYGLVRTWQQSTDGGANWSNIAGSQGRDTFKALVTGAMQYRFALTCSSNSLASYSNAVKVRMNDPYQCYCASYADGGTTEKADSSDIGSFSIGNYTFQVGGPHLQNPAATRERTDYTEDPANVIELWADSTYKIDIYHIMKGRVHKDAKVTLFMDFNNDFQYSNAPAGSGYPSERVLTAFTSASSYYLDNLLVTIPKGYIIPNKLTGMRLILNENTAANNPSDEGCGVYTSGETEDFAVIFRDPSAPQGVNGVTGNVKVLSLYPNPTSGAATLSYSSDVFVKDLEVTITSTTGQVISKKKFSNAGKSFTTEVNLADQARGIYFVEIKADGERIIRKLVTQ